MIRKAGGLLSQVDSELMCLAMHISPTMLEVEECPLVAVCGYAKDILQLHTCMASSSVRQDISWRLNRWPTMKARSQRIAYLWLDEEDMQASTKQAN